MEVTGHDALGCQPRHGNELSPCPTVSTIQLAESTGSLQLRWANARRWGNHGCPRE